MSIGKPYTPLLQAFEAAIQKYSPSMNVAPPVSAVSLTITGLSKADVDKAMSRLDQVLEKLLVIDGWTNSPNKAAICKIPQQQVLQGCFYTLALALKCLIF